MGMPTLSEEMAAIRNFYFCQYSLFCLENSFFVIPAQELLNGL